MATPLSRGRPDERLIGVIGPVVTTFDPLSGDVDNISFRSNLAAHLDAGLSGILVTGSTGEAALLNEAERLGLIEQARVAVPAEKVLLAGIGAESTRLTIQRARDAAAAGADGVLVVSPHYFLSSMTRAALWGHFSRVADESPVPVLLYNIPKYAHLVLSPDLVMQLAGHPNVAGIKDSSGDLEVLAGYCEAQREHPHFAVLTGNGPTFADALALGALGGILAVALFAPEPSLRIFRHARASNPAAAAEVQRALVPSAREIVGTFGVPGVKAALDHIGLVGGAVRSPLVPLADQQRGSVAALLDGLLEPAQSA